MAMTWEPTTDDILDLTKGVRRRFDSFRFELCDRNLNPIGSVHPDTSGSTPSIQNSTGSSTSRRLSGLKLVDRDFDEIDIMSDRLRVYMVLQNDVEFRLGTFMWADSNRPQRSWGEEQQPELVDLGFILEQNSTQAFGWSKGANINIVMHFLIFRAGFEKSQIKIIGPESDRGLADAMAWEPGSSWNQMLNDLGATVGFGAPWFDRDGMIHFDQIPDPEITSPTIPPYDIGTRVVADSVMYADDLLSAPNDFAVFDSGTDRLRIGRYQLPSSAPHSFANRGFRIGATESTQGITSQAMANKAARNLARKSDVFEILTFTSTADPRHDTHDVIRAFGKNWLETDWKLDLVPGGLMTHTMKRVSYDVT